MSISALVLYGSCARKDSTISSDVDLFALSSHAEYRMVVKNKTNIAIYPTPLALEMALNGDLFMLHITKEGQVLYDADGEYENLKNQFVYKNNYNQEIDKASALGWAIIRTGANVKNQTLVNKRMAWCVRTILIAKAAEQNRAIFAASELSAFFNDRSIIELIANKEIQTRQPLVMKLFEKFLTNFGTTEKLKLIDIRDYLENFRINGNTVGFKTLKAFSSDREFDEY